MNKIKNFIGQFVFLVSARFMVASVSWITNDASRRIAIDQIIKNGKAAETARSRWNTLT